MVKIYNRFTNNLICEEALLSLKETAQKNKANLWGADLWGADLWGADLRGADLWGADLREAKIADKKIINYKEVVGIGNSRRQLKCFMLDDNSFYFMAGCFWINYAHRIEYILCYFACTI